MPDWHLKEGDPLALTLAVDARLKTPDYSNDHIWQLMLRGGEPVALALETTYGLRARSMRLFPRFSEAGHSIIDPESFAKPTAIHRFFPNYLLLTFSPYPGIDVVSEYWVPENQAVCGRLRVMNNGVTPRQLGVDWIASLAPNEGGARMTPTKIKEVNTLAGETEGLHPIVFLTGGPAASSSPYPSLNTEFDILPGLEKQFVWVQAALDSPESSFRVAREIASRSWEAEIARLEMTNANQVEIKTGDPDWNACFAWGQKVALNLVHGPGDHLPFASFVRSRQPDQGFSLRGDGSDYDHRWNGQTALDAWYLASILLPVEPDLAKGFVRNFLAVQQEPGNIDWKPGLGGQRTHMSATPILAHLCWTIYQHTEDEAFLGEAFPALVSFLHSWFEPKNDRDGDGLPEWSHPNQAGFEDLSVYSRWPEGAPGTGFSSYESPALYAFLYQECRALNQMAAILGIDAPIPSLQRISNRMQEALQNTWDEAAGSYRYIERVFRPGLPSRSPPEGSDSAEEPPESGAPPKFWFPSVGSSGEIPRVGDLSQFLPLWAGIPSEVQAEGMVQQLIRSPESLVKPYGLPMLLKTGDAEPSGEYLEVLLPWNVLIGEGMLGYGFREEAAALFSRLMKGISDTVKAEKTFRARLHALTGHGLGEPNALPGLPPMGFFLDILGVRLISPWKIALEGNNPFPWTVEISFRGTVIRREAEETFITFPDGSTGHITDPAPCVVENRDLGIRPRGNGRSDEAAA